MCVCVCACARVYVCACAVCVCDVCVVCVCECVCVGVCSFINISNKMLKKCVVCALHTHTPTTTHSLTFTHTRALTRARAHTHISHPKRVNIHRLLFYTIRHLLGELELNSSNSTQFNLKLNLLIQIQSTNSIPNSTPFELSQINTIRCQTALNCSELWLVHLSDTPNTISIELNYFSIRSKIKKFHTKVLFSF